MMAFARSASALLRGLITVVSLSVVACTTGCAARMAHGHAARQIERYDRIDGSVGGGEALHVRLHLTAPADGLSLPAVAREIRDVWQRYLNVIVGADPGGMSVTDKLDILIGEIDSPSADALGWIEFVNGHPTPHVAVSLPRARRLVHDIRVMGRPLAEWPPSVYGRFLSQAVGRAIAHEIGHYVLRSSAHQSVGLMRAGLDVQDVMQPRGGRFRLTLAEEVVLWSRPSRSSAPLRVSMGR